MDHIYGNVEEYYPDNEGNIMIVFYDMTAYMLSEKN